MNLLEAGNLGPEAGRKPREMPRGETLGKGTGDQVLSDVFWFLLFFL